MEAHQRLAVAGLPADDEGHMFAQVGVGAESDDLCVLAGRDRQARPGDDLECLRIGIGTKVARRDWHGLARSLGVHQKGRENARNPRQFQRGGGGFGPVERDRLERALQRIAQI